MTSKSSSGKNFLPEVTKEVDLSQLPQFLGAHVVGD
jgi:hypothetical protein